MKKLFLFLVFITIAVFVAYNYVMAAPKDVASTSADVTINAPILAKDFASSEIVATEKYAEKVIAVSGLVTAVDDKSVTLDGKVNCVFKDIISVKKGESVKIKGLFIGYDEMFEEIKIDQCSFIK